MKLQYNKYKRLSFKQRRHGYASVAMVAALGVTSLLGLVAVFRLGMRSHESQTRNQIKIDYQQKEDAVLRALVAIVPNKAVAAMMPGSGADVNVRWDAIFRDAIAAANAEQAADANIVNSFNITDLVDANTGDAAGTLLPSSFVGVVDGAGSMVGPGTVANTGLISSTKVTGKLPPALNYSGPLSKDLLGPIISLGKTYPSTTLGLGANATTYPTYNLIPYPDIRLGFAAQGQNFIAKRNWWAFSMTFGSGVTLQNNTGTAASAIPTVTKNYVLSIYEVPAQSAVSAGGGTLQLGTYANGAAWSSTTVTGNAFGRNVVAGGTLLGGNATISARNTVTGSATVGGSTVSAGGNDLGTREARFASSGSDFYGMSDAGSSGRVAILPISQGDQFLRLDGSVASTGDELSDTGWFEYAMGGRQCSMMIEIVRSSIAAGRSNKPVAIRFHYIDNTGLPAVENLVMPPPRLPGDPQPIYAVGNGVWENHDRDLWVNPDGTSAPSVLPFYWENLTNNGINAAASSDPCLTIKIDRIPAYLNMLGAAGVDGSPGNPNNSIAIWANTAGAGVSQPSIPALAGELGVVMRNAEDLSPFLRGFSLVTDHRVYLAGDINQVPIALPAGSGLPGGTIHHPPVSVFAGEKRFGTSDTSVSSVTLAGQVSSMADTSGTIVNPLDLQTGTGTTGVNTGTITADLEQVLSPAQLPPVNKMTWIVTIEEVGAGFAQ